MNIVPTNMLGTAAQAIQSNPMFLMQEMLKKFEQEKLASLQAGQERTAQHQQIQEQRGAEMKEAGERYATTPKWGKADYAMTAASLILPLIGALLPQGKGLRGQRAKAGQQQALSGLGQGLGAVQQYRLGREEAGRERAYKGEMAGLEHLSGLADMSIQSQERQAATQMGAAGELMRGGIAAGHLGVAQQRGGRLRSQPPKVEKPPFTPTQVRTEDRMQILAEANQLVMPLQISALSGEVPMEGGQAPADIKRFTIKSIEDLVAIIYELEQGSDVKTLPGLPTRVDKHGILLEQLKQLRDQYLGGGQAGLGQGLPQGGMGETPLTPEEKAELEARRRR